MTFILTNDDGIDAPGIQALSQVLENQGLGSLGMIVAPVREFSGCGHQVTTRHPLQLQHRSQRAVAVAGTPADCVRVAISHLCSDIDWVIAGINPGGNMGVDVYISGTVAAVREAAFHGIPAIAFSQYRQGGKPVNWEVTTGLATQVLGELLSRELAPGYFWNVNFPYWVPDAPEPDLVFCQPSRQPLPLAYQVQGDTLYYCGKYGERAYEAGTDVAACFAGHIAVTQLQV